MYKMIKIWLMEGLKRWSKPRYQGLRQGCIILTVQEIKTQQAFLGGQEMQRPGQTTQMKKLKTRSILEHRQIVLD